MSYISTPPGLKRRTRRRTLSPGMVVCSFCLLAGLSVTGVFLFTHQSQASSTRSSANSSSARLSPSVTMHPSRSRRDTVPLAAGRDLITTFDGPAHLQATLDQNLAQPLTLASADFDEDGTPDLAIAYDSPDGPLVAVRRGNVDSIYPNAPEAQRRKAANKFTEAPFLSPARLLALAVVPDFIGAGDFDADSHSDLVFASRTGKALHLLSGDGAGQFRLTREITLPGAVSAMLVGEINRRDGLADVVLGVDSEGGAKVMVFEGAEGALRSRPEIFHAPARVTSLALGQLDDHHALDLAVATGNHLLVLGGRDRKLSLSQRDQASVQPALVDQRTFPFALRSLAIGEFNRSGVTDLALLAEDGDLHFVYREPRAGVKATAGYRGSAGSKSITHWQLKTLATQFKGATGLITARLSGNPTDDLLMVNPSGRRLAVLATAPRDSKRAGSDTGPDLQAAASFDLNGAPGPVLPMRLDKDALSDLVVARSGSSSPSIVLSAARDGGPGLGPDHVIFSNPSSIAINGGSNPPVIATPYPSTITVSGQPPVDKLRVKLNRIKHSSLQEVGVLLVGPNGQKTHLMSAAGRVGDHVELSLTFDDAAGSTVPRFNDIPITGTYKPSVFGPSDFPAPAPGGPHAEVLSVFNGTDPNGTWSLYAVNRGTFGLGEISEGWSLIFGPDSAAQAFVVTNTNDSGPGSLRQAILDANDKFGADVINFNIASSARTIKPASLLPTITDAVTIDGTSQPGFAGKPIIELSGREPDFNGPALNITASDCVIRGLVINSFIGRPFRAIQSIYGGHNIFEGNFIGTDVSGTVALSRGDPTFSETAMIGIDLNTSNNLVGGTTAAARNVISGNTLGIFLDRCNYDDPVTGNVIQGNFIGTDFTGTQLLENGTGITTGAEGFCGEAPNTTIGGTVAGSRNVIVGGSFRIHLVGAAASLVQGNFIGTDVSGAVDLDATSPTNRGDGIDISQRSTDVTVGGTTAAARNVISGNWFGVQINGSNTSGCLVQGNYIGTDASGSTTLKNLFSGVYMLFGAANNTVGGAVAGARNVISGNDRHGIEIGKLDKAATTSNVIQGNYIGTDASGLIPLGNGHLSAGGGDGINVPANADGNRIEENLIAFNSRNGVFMPPVPGGSNTPGLRIQITDNHIFANGTLGIDLGDLGVTANDFLDPDSGPNNLQNFPLLNSSSISGANEAAKSPQLQPDAAATVLGTLNSTPNTAFTVHWYFGTGQCANNQPSTRPLVTGKVPGVITDANGNAPFTVNFELPAGIDGGMINCTATDSQGNTSEFSACLPVGVVLPPPSPSPTPSPGPTPIAGPTPNNDSFAAAMELSGTSGRVLGNNVSASKETGEPNHGGNKGAKSIWYRWQATLNGSVTLYTYGSSFDTLLGVYTGSVVSGLTQVGGNDDDDQGASLTSLVTFQAAAGTVYHIAVDGNSSCGFLGGNCSGDAGGVVLTWNQFPSTTLQFERADIPTTENAATAEIRVSRAGENSQAATVDYATSDTGGSNCNTPNTSNASSRCDYQRASGTLHFAAGETFKTVLVSIVDDSYAEGNERFTITLSNAKGAGLGAFTTANLIIADNDTVTSANPIAGAGFFARLHYIDFLNREPDASGLGFWRDQIIACGTDPACVDLRRTNVSAAFYVSIEFQETGYLVYRLYKSAYGNLPGLPVPLRFSEFLPDTQAIGSGVVVGVGDWQSKLEENKRLLASTFVARSRFISAFPTSLSPAQFVDALYQNAGVTPSESERFSVIGEFGTAITTMDNAARARVIRRVAENGALAQQEFNKAFVLMQYFGYLRRNPNDSPEPGLNFDGYNFWLTKLNQFGGNYVEAEMVRAFIISDEYRQRFGP